MRIKKSGREQALIFNFNFQLSARTVAGHEAARLGSQLAASQRQRRELGVICEPKARSYDHQRQDKPEKCKYIIVFECEAVIGMFTIIIISILPCFHVMRINKLLENTDNFIYVSKI